MKTSIIICTYNEEKTIFGVVAACCKHNPESEIIVVDDGSTDKTESLLDILSNHYEFAYLKLIRNRGKNYAMAHGVEYASGDVILFFNANVSDIKKDHFDQLLAPVCNNEVDMVLGAPSETLIDYQINPFKSVTGERVILKEDLMPLLPDIREVRFGIEEYLNLYYQSAGKRIKYVLLNGLQYSDENSSTNSNNLITDNNEARDIANTLLFNIDLITKRVQNNIQKNNYTRSTLTSVQFELNRKIKNIKDKMQQPSLSDHMLYIEPVH